MTGQVTGWYKAGGQHVGWLYYWLDQYYGGGVVAWYHPKTEEFYAVVGDKLVKTRPPWVKVPVKVADGPKVKEGPVDNFGVDVDKLRPVERPRYVVNGREVSREEALAAADGKLEDDSVKWRLTFIGPDQFRAQVYEAYSALPAGPFTQNVLLSGYQATDWQIKRFELDVSEKFKGSGKALIFQAPGGKVVHIQYDFKPADMVLLAANFDPNKVPDLRTPAKVDFAAIWKWVTEGRDFSWLPPWWAILLGGIGVFLFFRKRSN